jgi:hypothetical protein
VIERAIKKGDGFGEEKMSMEHLVSEEYAPHKVPVIVEVYSDNISAPRTKFARFSVKASSEPAAATSSFSITSASSKPTAPTSASTLKLLPSKPARTTSSYSPISRMMTSQRDAPEPAFLPNDPSPPPYPNGSRRMAGTRSVSGPGNTPVLSDEDAADAGDFLQALEDHEGHRVWANVR